MNRNGGKKGAWRHSARVTAKASCGGAERAWDGGSVDGPRSHEFEAGQRGALERPRGFARRRRWNWLVVAAALCLALGGPESARGVDLVPGRSRVHGPRIHWMTLRGGGEAGKEESEKENDGGALSNLMEEAGERDDDPEAEEMQKGRGLWFAADEGDEEELDEWVARGADVNSTTHTQLNAGAPLHWAAMKGRLGVMEKLLNLGADVNGRSKKDNQTALHWAASKGMTEACRLLHSRGADVNAADSCGWTPLHSAAYWGKESSCGALLSMGAHVSPVDIEGDTPLHNAAYRGWQRISNLLVQHGADLDAVNSQERCAQEVAEWCGHTSIAEELGRVKEAGQSAADRGHSDFSLRVWTPPGGGDDGSGGSGSDGSDEDEVHGNYSSPPQAM